MKVSIAAFASFLRSRWPKRILWFSGFMIVLTSPSWGPRLLSKLDFFHVRRIEFAGVRYSDAGQLAELLDLDTLSSVWLPLDSLSGLVRSHPMLLNAYVRRRLPSTLLVTVEERVPVALIASDSGLVPVDSDGLELPVDPSLAVVDVPFISTPDSSLYRLLGQLREGDPSLWSRLSSVTKEKHGDIRFSLQEREILTNQDVTVARLADILPVEADLTNRRIRAVELDLRYRDQVIARLP